MQLFKTSTVCKYLHEFSTSFYWFTTHVHDFILTEFNHVEVFCQIDVFKILRKSLKTPVPESLFEMMFY